VWLTPDHAVGSGKELVDLSKRKDSAALAGIYAGMISSVGLTLFCTVWFVIRVTNGTPSTTNDLGVGWTLITAISIVSGVSLYWVNFIGGRRSARYVLLSVISAGMMWFFFYLLLRRIWDLAA
jgi:uncharacterized RDD family membrane protein YckC